MMRRLQPQLIASIVFSVLLAGCGGEKRPPAAGQPAQEATAPSADELFAHWQRLADAPADELDAHTAVALAAALAQAGETHRLIEVLGTEQESPVAKVLAVISLTPLLSADMIEPLEALTGTEHEGTTRAGATKLLTTMLLPDMRPQENGDYFRAPSEAELAGIRDLMRRLGGDAEFRVRLAALGGLSRVGDPDAAAELTLLWNDPALRPGDRTEIFGALPAEDPAQHRAILLDAVEDVQLDPDIRVAALSYLGRIADPEVLTVVRRVAENDPVAGIREMAEQAANALRARMESTPAPQPELPTHPGQ